MGRGYFRENSASVRWANQTEIPMVYVIKQVGNLYWGVLQPGERKVVITGRVWFTLVAYPYDGHNEPTKKDAVLGTLIPVAAVLGTAVLAVVTGGAAAPAAGTAAAALTPIVTSATVINSAIFAGSVTAGTLSMAAKAALEKTLGTVTKNGHYANGDWVHIRGGPKAGVPPTEWTPLRFEA